MPEQYVNNTRREARRRLPAGIARALIEEATRVWYGEAEELRFWRHDKHARMKLMEQSAKRSVASE